MSRPTGRPAPYGGPVPEAVRTICRLYLTATGWTVQGDWPAVEKAVLVAAPHTSNWDGLNMLAAAGYYRVKLRWMGKSSLTTGPFGWLIKALGCVPIDRSARHDVVQAMADAFAARAGMLLAIPPEGTRSLARDWKTGFYHIACKAGVPIIITVLDYGSKTISVPAVFNPTGDFDADIPHIRAHYEGAVGRNRSQFTTGA